MFRITLLVLILLSLVVLAQNVKQPPQFEVTLPAGWMQLSHETGDFLTQQLNYHTSTQPRQPYDYLYQRKSSDSLFTLPYVLVQVHAAPRLTVRELESFGKKNFLYDAQSHYLWGYRDSVIEVIIPTNDGTINLFCYSSKADFPLYKDQFVQILHAVRVQEPLMYRHNFFRDIPMMDHFFHNYNVNGFLILLVIVVLIIARVQSKKSASVR
jgi:hypothetical protein